MRNFLLLNLIVLFLITGCASVQEPVNFEPNNTNKNGKIGILITEAPNASAQYTGNIGLLDWAIIASVNAGLNKHLKTLTFDDYSRVGLSLKESLSSQGYETVLIEPMISIEESKKLKLPKKGLSKNDYSTYQEEHKLGYVLLVKFHSVGTTRSYYGPAPLTKPLAVARMTAELVDLSDKTLKWFVDVTGQHIIQEPWDESKSRYPNLTTAVYKAFEDARKTVVSGVAVD